MIVHHNREHMRHADHLAGLSITDADRRVFWLYSGSLRCARYESARRGGASGSLYDNTLPLWIAGVEQQSASSWPSRAEGHAPPLGPTGMGHCTPTSETASQEGENRWWRPMKFKLPCPKRFDTCFGVSKQTARLVAALCFVCQAHPALAM